MQSTYRLRELSAEEAPAIEPLLHMLAEHHRAAAAEHGADHQPTPVARLIAEYAGDACSGKGRIAVVENEVGPIGCCVIGVVGREGYIDELAVAPSHRGQGLGTQLMTWALDTFRAAGATQLELMIVEGNEGAARSYEHFGFRTTARVMKKTAL